MKHLFYVYEHLLNYIMRKEHMARLNRILRVPAQYWSNRATTTAATTTVKQVIAIVYRNIRTQFGGQSGHVTSNRK